MLLKKQKFTNDNNFSTFKIYNIIIDLCNRIYFKKVLLDDLRMLNDEIKRRQEFVTLTTGNNKNQK
jgi:hypothetical protein